MSLDEKIRTVLNGYDIDAAGQIDHLTAAIRAVLDYAAQLDQHDQYAAIACGITSTIARELGITETPAATVDPAGFFGAIKRSPQGDGWVRTEVDGVAGWRVTCGSAVTGHGMVTDEVAAEWPVIGAVPGSPAEYWWDLAQQVANHG